MLITCAFVSDDFPLYRELLTGQLIEVLRKNFCLAVPASENGREFLSPALAVTLLPAEVDATGSDASDGSGRPFGSIRQGHAVPAHARTKISPDFAALMGGLSGPVTLA
jgi:hypothetical protein